MRTDGDIARVFSKTPQTIRNWKRKHKVAQENGRSAPIPHWLALAKRGYEIDCKRPNRRLKKEIEKNGLEWFAVWRKKYGLTTLDKAGAAFGITRQAVHNWVSHRERLPTWIYLACLAYEEKVEDLLALDVSEKDKAT